MLHHLGILSAHEDGFSKIKSASNKSAYWIIYDDFDINEDEIWKNGDWFYATEK